MGEVFPFKLLRQKDVAVMLDVSGSWLEQIRLRGGGPAFCKIGKNVRYRIEDVKEWINAQRRFNTSQVTAQI